MFCLISVAGINITTKSTWGRKDLFGSHIPDHDSSPREQRVWGSTASQLALTVPSSAFLQPRTTCLGGHHPQWAGLPTPVINRENAPHLDGLQSPVGRVLANHVYTRYTQHCIHWVSWHKLSSWHPQGSSKNIRSSGYIASPRLGRSNLSPCPRERPGVGYWR